MVSLAARTPSCACSTSTRTVRRRLSSWPASATRLRVGLVNLALGQAALQEGQVKRQADEPVRRPGDRSRRRPRSRCRSRSATGHSRRATPRSSAPARAAGAASVASSGRTASALSTSVSSAPSSPATGASALSARLYCARPFTPIACSSCALATAWLFTAVTSCTRALATAVRACARSMSGRMPAPTKAWIWFRCFS